MLDGERVLPAMAYTVLRLHRSKGPRGSPGVPDAGVGGRGDAPAPRSEEQAGLGGGTQAGRWLRAPCRGAAGTGPPLPGSARGAPGNSGTPNRCPRAGSWDAGEAPLCSDSHPLPKTPPEAAPARAAGLPPRHPGPALGPGGRGRPQTPSGLRGPSATEEVPPAPARWAPVPGPSRLALLGQLTVDPVPGGLPPRLCPSALLLQPGRGIGVLPVGAGHPWPGLGVRGRPGWTRRQPGAHPGGPARWAQAAHWRR